MKFYETHFDDYIQSVQQVNFHPNSNSNPKSRLPSTLVNCIFYGPPGSGKYSQMLSYLRSFSPSQLKYESKITVTTDKQIYKYRMSDIHYEIDMALLGCNAKTVWHEIYTQIVDVVSMKTTTTTTTTTSTTGTTPKFGVLVCKNFHWIHNELLDIFYSYMQQYRDSGTGTGPGAGMTESKTIPPIRLYFILMTEHVSFLPNNIRNTCVVLPIPRPSKTLLGEGLGILKTSFPREKMREMLEEIHTADIMNLKELYSFALVAKESPPSAETTTTEGRFVQGSCIPKDNFNTVCDNIIETMESNSPSTPMDLALFRDHLYDILIYGLDAAECVFYVLSHFLRLGRFRDQDDEKGMDFLTEQIVVGLRQYGNNYRAIFHLEMIFMAMMVVF